MTTRSRFAAFTLPVLLIVATVVAGCASPRDIRKEFEPYVLSPAGTHRVYVATEDTPWKQDVVARLSDELGHAYRLTVDNLRSLGDVRVAEWDAVVVLSTYYAFGLQSDTAAFLKRVQQKEKVILVATSSITDLKDYGVDAVSAASEGETKETARALTPARPADEVAREIAPLVRARAEE